LYRFFYYPDTTRLRLSQCIILPPYQGCGHGAHLYSIIYFWLLTRPEISELAGKPFKYKRLQGAQRRAPPVEDPSETFQDLRDKIDLGVLLAQEAVLSLPLDKEWVKETRQAMKLGEVRAPRRRTGLG
jgi:histone acetyltransferase 1